MVPMPGDSGQLFAGSRAADHLQVRWQQLFTRLGPLRSDMGATLYLCLQALYSYPPRAYHTLAHVAACLEVFDSVRSAADAPDAVEFALWLHDCVYDPRRQDNEARSAQAAEMMLAVNQASPELGHVVRALVLVTRHDGSAATNDERLLADIDLSILAAGGGDYDGYAEQIRREYAFANDSAYCLGRLKFIERLLRRPKIFLHCAMGNAMEEAARTNLQRERARLGGM